MSETLFHPYFFSSKRHLAGRFKSVIDKDDFSYFARVALPASSHRLGCPNLVYMAYLPALSLPFLILAFCDRFCLFLPCSLLITALFLDFGFLQHILLIPALFLIYSCLYYSCLISALFLDFGFLQHILLIPALFLAYSCLIPCLFLPYFCLIF